MRDGRAALNKTKAQLSGERLRKRNALTITSAIVEPKPSQNQPVNPTAINPEVFAALIRSRFIR